MKDENVPGFDSQLANLNGRINPYTEIFKWLFGMSKHTFIGIMTAITGELVHCDIHVKTKQKMKLTKILFDRTSWRQIWFTGLSYEGQS